MKLLYLTPGVFDKGGISRYNRFQIKALREILGTNNVKVISFLGPTGTGNDLESGFDTEWHGDQKIPQFLRIVQFSINALFLALRFQPDIIWCGLINYSTLVYFLSTLVHAKSVMQVYGYEVWSLRKYRPDINWGFLHCDYVISDCHFTANYITQVYKSWKEIPVLWDCVDITRFYPCEPNYEVIKKYNIPDPKKNFNILTLGRINKNSAYKGFERLLSLFPTINNRATLIFGGDGDLVPYLQKLSVDLGVSERVFFLGFVHDSDLPDIYRSASIFCLVGDRGLNRGEGIPLTPLEAAACGKPILVGDQDGSKESVAHGINGYALDPFNLPGIADKINMLIQDDKLRNLLGTASRQRIENYHSYTLFKSKIQDFVCILEKKLQSN